MPDTLASHRIGIVVALASVAAVAGVALLLSPYLGAGSLALLFILPVMLAAAQADWSPASSRRGAERSRSTSS